MSSDSSSPGSPGSPKVAPCQPEGAHRQQGALQGEMNALFVQKLEEIRSHSLMFSTGKACHPAASRALYPPGMPRSSVPAALCFIRSISLTCGLPASDPYPHPDGPVLCGGCRKREA